MDKKNSKKKKAVAEKSLFAKQMDASPKGHRMSVALGLAGLAVDIPTGHLIAEVIDKITEMGDDFDLRTAATIRANTERKFDILMNKQ